MRTRARALALAAALAAAPGCSATISPATIQDAQTAARVKSVIVNDPGIGIYPIEVRVSNGVARLSGRVPTAAAADRAVTLARDVAGVIDVRSELRIEVSRPGPDAAVEPDRTLAPASSARTFADTGERLGGPADRRLLAVGASIGWNTSGAGPLDASSSIGPVLRLGSGRGLGLALGFSWFGADLRATTGPDEVVGRVRVRPVMGGLGYTLGNDRLSMSLSTVGGIAFNGLSASDRLTGHQVPLAVGKSLVLRPGVSWWFDATGRMALNVSAGYVITRPRIAMLEAGEIVRRRLTLDTLVLRTGVAYKVF